MSGNDTAVARPTRLGLVWGDDSDSTVYDPEFYQGLLSKIRGYNQDFPPNGNLGSYMTKFLGTDRDCSEISEDILDYAESGEILHATPLISGTLVIPIMDGRYTGYYHDVYSDGQYVYDPEFAPFPIPKGDWTKMIKILNPFSTIKQRASRNCNCE